MMKAKIFLSEAYKIDQRIKLKYEQLENFKDIAESTTSKITGMPFMPKGNEGSKVGDCVTKIVDLQDEINAEINELVEKRKEIMSKIRLIKAPDLQLLLEMRYLANKTWEEISFEMSISPRCVFRKHGAALKEMEKILSWQ